MKFSYPHADISKTLFLHIENVWGDFKVFLSKDKIKFPGKDNNDKVIEFISTGAGFLNSLKTIEINNEYLSGTSRVAGVYYLGIEASTSTSLNLQFYEKTKLTSLDTLGVPPTKISVHNLNAG